MSFMISYATRYNFPCNCFIIADIKMNINADWNGLQDIDKKLKNNKSIRRYANVFTSFANYKVIKIYRHDILRWIRYYITTGCAFVLTQEIFHYRNSNIFTLWQWLNDENCSFLKLDHFNRHVCLQNNFNHLKLRYSDMCNFLTRHALVSQPRTHMVATIFALFELTNAFANDYH